MGSYWDMCLLHIIKCKIVQSLTPKCFKIAHSIMHTRFLFMVCQFILFHELHWCHYIMQYKAQFLVHFTCTNPLNFLSFPAPNVVGVTSTILQNDLEIILQHWNFLALEVVLQSESFFNNFWIIKNVKLLLLNNGLQQDHSEGALEFKSAPLCCMWLWVPVLCIVLV